MRKFNAGRFEVRVYVGAQNGRSTTLHECRRNGSGDHVGSVNIDFEDLPDVLHVLQRAIAAHHEARAPNPLDGTRAWDNS